MKSMSPRLLVLVALSAAAVSSLAIGMANIRQLRSLVVAGELAHPDALWRIVHDGCVIDESSFGRPAPCLEVNAAKGYAIIKDPERATQLLLVPTKRIRGIESPALLAGDSENYWFDAWSAKRWLESELGGTLGDADMGLAVNSRLSRTQDQLHIHIDCVRPAVRAAISTTARSLGRDWTRLPAKLFGSTYDALWIDRGELIRSDPFRLLGSDERVRGDMGSYSLALIGAERSPGEFGFVLLRSHETAANFGAPSGERLLDHRCRLARSADDRR